MISVNLAFDGYVGLSTDSKPTEDVNNGSRFYEMDTAKSYMFDAEGLSWIEQPAQGGGSGGAGLYVTTIYDSDTGIGTLDRTWQEIYDAMKEGRSVVYGKEQEPEQDVDAFYLATSSIACTREQDNYSVIVDYMSADKVVFIAATADDYPVEED